MASMSSHSQQSMTSFNAQNLISAWSMLWTVSSTFSYVGHIAKAHSSAAAANPVPCQSLCVNAPHHWWQQVSGEQLPVPWCLEQQNLVTLTDEPNELYDKLSNASLPELKMCRFKTNIITYFSDCKWLRNRSVSHVLANPKIILMATHVVAFELTSECAW